MFVSRPATCAHHQSASIYKQKYLLLSIVLFITLFSQASWSADVISGQDNETCSPGFSIRGSDDLVLNGDFATSHGSSAEVGDLIAGSFTASIPYVGDDIYSPDTSISIQDGPANYFGGIVVQEVFPGDPRTDVPALDTYLYSNGNSTGGPYRAWTQTIEVEPSTEYLFIAYVSNMIIATSPQPDDPIISFTVDGMQIGDEFVVEDETVESGDVWIRVTRVFRTADDQTSIIFSMEDRAPGSLGDDLALTAIRVRECQALNNLPIANDDVVSTAEQTIVSINVLANDSDPDGDEISVTSIDSVPANGMAIINADGEISYTPNAGFIGADSFTYTITDANGDSASATVTVNVTMLPDFDMDGVPDDIDIDDDNDGILDSEEGTDDFDGDGIPNFQDLDADGDGILDFEESGLNEDAQAALDTNGDGQIDPDNDFGANGLADGVETAPESGQPDYTGDGNADLPIDHDQDGNPDFLDLDSDNDSIPDVIEAGLLDEDQDGFADPGQDPTISPPDTDGDGVKDVHDLDDDNDGLTDASEAGSLDADGDGVVDDFMDADADGYNDASAADPAPLPDTDGDGVPDYLDPDSDNDGISDTTEAGLPDADGDGMIDDFNDEDGDGLDDDLTNNPPDLPDADGDGIPDVLDLDNPAGGGGQIDPPECDCTLETGLDGHGGGSSGLLLLSGLLLVVIYRFRASVYSSLKRSCTVFSMAALFLSSATVSASDNSPEAREFDKRLYGGLSIGLSNIEPFSPCGCYFVSDDQDTAFGLHLGYDLTKRFSIEANYANLGEAGIGRTSTGLDVGGVDYQHLGVSAIGYLYNARAAEDYTDGFADEGYFRREGFSVYARVGLSTMDNSSNLEYNQQNDIQLHLGGGLEYGWSNGFAVRAEYTSYDEDAQALTLGISKRFGKARPYIVPVAEVVEEPPAEEFAAIDLKSVPEESPPLVLPIIYFATDSAMINSVEQQKLDTMMEQLVGQKGQLNVTGHTDSRGSSDYNQALSERRAQQVSEFLKSGNQELTDIDISTVGLGESSPAAANDSPPGRQRNRRVEFNLELEE